MLPRLRFSKPCFSLSVGPTKVDLPHYKRRRLRKVHAWHVSVRVALVKLSGRLPCEQLGATGNFEGLVGQLLATLLYSYKRYQNVPLNPSHLKCTRTYLLIHCT